MNKLKNLNYKQTEIGEIPEDWQVTTLGGTATLNYGKSLPEMSRSEGGVPVYGSSGVTGYHSQALVQNEGYIIGRKGTIGTVHYSPEPFYPIDTTYYVTKDDINCDFKYFYYLLKYLNLNKLNFDSAVPGLNRGVAYRQKYAAPKTISEQQQIASILSSLDDKIELNRKMNKTLEEVGKALFKRWFVDFEFPNDDGKPYKSSGGEMVDSELGEIPEGWEVKPLDAIATFLNGVACQKYPPKDEDGLPVIKIGELHNGITENSDRASSSIASEYIIEDGDVLFSWSGCLEIVLWAGGRGVLNQHLFKVSSESYPKWFYYHWTLRYLPFFREIASNKVTTMGHIQRSHLTESLVLVPHQKTLMKMDLVMAALLNNIIANSIGIKSLAQIRDSLLPRLMSGKLRVKDYENN